MKNFNKFFNNKFFYKNFSKKTFSNMNGGSKAATMFKYGALGIAVGGLSLLSIRNYMSAGAYSKALLNTTESFNSKIVQQRTRDTIVYFSSGLALTAGLTTLMARSRLAVASMNPLIALATIPASIFFMYKIHTTPQNSTSKPLYFLGFNSCIAFSLVPLSVMIPVVVLRDAGLLTCGLMSGLGLVTVTCKDDAFLGWSGMLGGGLGVLAALSIANIFLNSPVINNIWLYGGLALFMALTMYDMKEVQIRAKKQSHFDPMAESIKVYMDFINLFVRLALILNNSRNKK